MLIYYCDFASVEVVIKNYLLTYLLTSSKDHNVQIQGAGTTAVSCTADFPCFGLRIKEQLRFV